MLVKKKCWLGLSDSCQIKAPVFRASEAIHSSSQSPTSVLLCFLLDKGSSCKPRCVKAEQLDFKELTAFFLGAFVHNMMWAVSCRGAEFKYRVHDGQQNRIQGHKLRTEEPLTPGTPGPHDLRAYRTTKLHGSCRSTSTDLPLACVSHSHPTVTASCCHPPQQPAAFVLQPLSCCWVFMIVPWESFCWNVLFKRLGAF